MEGAPISIILDVVILVLLGLTIVYAARLSLQLRRLRDSKSDLDRVVRDLIKNLDKADRAVAGMKETAREAGADLQDSIDRAVAISDELEVMNDSGNRLAARLEALMDTARPMVSGAAGVAPVLQPARAAAPQAPVAPQAEQPSNYAQHLRKLELTDDKPAKNSFSIRDTDAERGIDPVAAMEDDAAQGLYTEAERELFRAMKGRGKS